MERRMHSNLGDAVHARQHRPLQSVHVYPRLQGGWPECLAAEDDMPQLMLLQGTGESRSENAERCRSLVEHGNTLTPDEIRALVWIAGYGAIRHDEAPAMKECSPDLPYRKIEGDRVV